MYLRAWILSAVAMMMLIVSGNVHAALIGASAELNTIFHNVSGTVTITDEDSFRVDNFTYDGGGPAVYFYLGTTLSNAAFTDGLAVDPILTGTAYDGTQGSLFFDLPLGETFNNYHAISVWCADFKVDFGSGLFFPIQGDLNNDGFVGIEDLGHVLGAWNMTFAPGTFIGDPNGDGFVGIEDLNIVLGNWNNGTPPVGNAGNVPEPGICAVMLLSAGAYLGRRRG